jgi:hypothetical protein
LVECGQYIQEIKRLQSPSKWQRILDFLDWLDDSGKFEVYIDWKGIFEK